MDVVRIEKPPESVSLSGNFAGLDAVRGAAALAVVLLHACVPYLRNPMPGLVWPVVETASDPVDAVFWGIEVFIMPLFLVIAGFFLWRSEKRNDPRELIRSRSKRLLIPLAFGLIVILPVDLYVWTAGLIGEGLIEPVKLKSLKFGEPISDRIWGLSHLWFLMYVFSYVAFFGGLRLATKRLGWGSSAIDGRRARRFVMAGWLVSAVAILVVAPEVVWGFQHAFWPIPSKWVYSGLFFAAGCLLAKWDGNLEWTAKTSPRMAALAVLFLWASVTLGQWCLSHSAVDRATRFDLLRSESLSPSVLLTLATLTVIAAVACTFSLVGLSIRYLQQISPAVRYLAAASFWIYLVHHPFLGLIHIDLKALWPEGSSAVKAIVSFGLSTAFSLVTYEAFVRRTRLGRLLGMADRPRRRSDSSTDGNPDILSMPMPQSQDGMRRAA